MCDNELLKKLKTWRSEVTEQNGYEFEYFVLKNNTLIELATTKPLDERSLFGISGIGAKTGRKYGKELLKIIHSHQGAALDSSSANRLFTGVPAPEECHGLPWEYEDCIRLGQLVKEGSNVKQLAHMLGRTQRAIECKLIDLNLNVPGFSPSLESSISPFRGVRVRNHRTNPYLNLRGARPGPTNE